MSISARTAVQQSGSAALIAVTLPTSTAANDLVVCSLIVGTAGLTITKSAGTGTWNLITAAGPGASASTYMFAYSQFVTGDTAPTFSWTSSASFDLVTETYTSSLAKVISFDKWSTTPATAAAANAITAPSLSGLKLASGELAVVMSAAISPTNVTSATLTYTAPSGFTAAKSNESASSPVRFVALAHLLSTASSTETPASMSVTDTKSNTFDLAAVTLVASEGVISAGTASLSGTGTLTATGPVTLTNSFEGITPSGTTITLANSGGVSGNAFSAVTTPAASDSTHAMHGSLSAKFAAVGTGCFVQWTGIGSVATLWFRVYLYVTANPAANSRFLSTQTSAGTVCGIGYITTTGKVLMANSAGGTVLTTTNSVNLNAWTRIEGFITGSATVGQEELKLYLTPDSATATETQTSAANLATGGTIDKAAFGPSNAVTYTEWLDDIGTSTTAYLGPSVKQGTASLSGTGSLTAAVTQQCEPALSGTGSLTAAVTQQCEPALSGTGTLTAAGSSVSGASQGTAALAGAGTLSAAATQRAAASLSGTGATASLATQCAAAGISGSGSIAAIATTRVTAALSGTGVLAASAVQGTSSALSGTGALAAKAAQQAAAALSGTGQITGLVRQPCKAALSGTATLTATASAGGPQNITGADTGSAPESVRRVLVGDGFYGASDWVNHGGW